MMTMTLGVSTQSIEVEDNHQEGYQSEERSFPKFVKAHGYGLTTGLVGQPNIFSLDAREAGNGDFDVVIKGASRATIEYHEEDESRYKIKYHVTLPGDYLIDVKYEEKHIPGSPFTAHILDPQLEADFHQNKRHSTVSRGSDNNRLRLGSGYLAGGSTNSTSFESFPSSTNETSDEEMLPIEAKIKTPSGRELQGRILRKTNGDIRVKFPREEIGAYSVTILNKKDNSPLPGSPYEVMVRPREIQSSDIQVANMGEASCFTIYGTKGLDVRNLYVGVSGRAGVKLRVFQNDCDSIDILYEVRRLGTYQFHVHDQGSPIPGSPFTVRTNKKNLWKSKGENNAVVTYTLTLWHGCDAKRGSLKTSLVSPAGCMIPHTLTRRGRFLVEVKFLPRENGLHVLDVLFPNQLRDTFRVQVRDARDPRDLFDIAGLKDCCPMVNQPSNVFIRPLVPLEGSFTLDVCGPDQVNVMQTRTDDGRIFFAYVGRSAGKYVLSVKYDGFHIGHSPYRVFIDDEMHRKTLAIEHGNNLERINLGSNLLTQGYCVFGDISKTVKAGESSTFTVDADQSLDVGFSSECRTGQIETRRLRSGIYEVEFRVETRGQYEMYVICGNEHIRGSPFHIAVT